ncbi:hypothetical protein CGLO_12182 [Colletotrichum gloeosporioides Cg-14]|uniref:Uncharacterized protein n=1 Tax=Colletotrichum gloeosporioides (strain Cg-14) TaxID=1237896 RepID=T0K968_COLGC|nr:hypothetical protein CGLO_12182 [Colletotrichum gloeosporioides Cg-14]
MPCPTHDHANNVDRRDLGGDSCPMNCPQWSLYDWKSSDRVEDDQSDAEKRDFALAGRILVSRADKSNVRKIGECRIETAWPAGKPVATPAYASGPEFLEADQGGFMNVDESRRKSSMEVPRWYSLRSAEAPACTPSTVTLNTQDMYNVMQRLKKSEEEHKGKKDESAFLFNNQPDRPSLDHLWEKNWATDFLLKSVLDDGNAAAPLADSPGGKAGKMNCKDFKAYIFGSHEEGKRGTQNLIASVYNAMPSKNNLEFVGMTQDLNEKAKGLLWNPRNLNPEVAANMKDAAKLPVAAALKELDKKMNFLFTMQQGVWVSNIPKAVELMQRTNNRVYNEFIKADEILAKQNPEVKALTQEGGYLNPRFRQHMDNFLNNPETGIKALVINSADSIKQVIATGFESLNERAERISKAGLTQDFEIGKKKWEYLRNLPRSTWELQISWSWLRCDALSRRDGEEFGACHFAPPTSIPPESTITSSLAPTETSLPTDANTFATTSSSASEMITDPAGSCTRDEECRSIQCSDGSLGACLSLPLGRGNTTHTSMKTPPPKTSLQSKPSSTTVVPPRWTQSCNPGGLRFDKDAATGFVEEYCKKATWDDKWFGAATDGKMVKQKGISVWENQNDDKVSSFRFIIHAVKPANEGNRKAWCDTEGKGSQLNTALELLQSDDGVQECRKQLQELIKCRPDANNADRPSGGTRAGLCLQWTLQVTRDEV